MKTTDESIDKLTRSLMENTAEQPSVSLNARIMALIMGEKRAAFKKCYIKKLPSPFAIFIGFAAYMMLIAGGASLFMKQAAGGDELIQSIKHFFPLLLTVGSGVSIFFFFAQLDNWLRVKESIKEKPQSK